MSLRGTLIDRELDKIRQIFPDIRRRDFRSLPNGNKCVQVSYATYGKYACGIFDVLIEFPFNYPIEAPHAWVQKPELPKETPHVYKRDEEGHADICYLRPKKDWNFSFSSYEAVILIENWLSTYCRWTKTGSWDWPEAGFFDHVL